MEKIVEMENFSFSYGGEAIFYQFSFTMVAGDFCVILGPMGSGKTTLARILMGLEATHDYIKINNLFMNPKNLTEIRKNVKVVFENPIPFLSNSTVYQELAFALSKTDCETPEKKIRQFVQEFPIESLLSKNVFSLSNGEKQIVSLASALLQNPKLLVLDEALSLIDENKKEQILDFLKQENQKGLSILWLTNDSENLMYGNKFLFLDKGELIFSGKPEDVAKLEKELNSHHLELPFFIDLSKRLSYYGKCSEIPKDYKELVDQIWK